MSTAAPAQLRLPTFDGRTVDKIELAFSGTLELNPLDPEDRELFDALKLGKEVTYTLGGNVSSKSTKRKVSSEGDEEIRSTVTLQLDSLVRNE